MTEVAGNMLLVAYVRRNFQNRCESERTRAMDPILLAAVFDSNFQPLSILLPAYVGYVQAGTIAS